MHGRGQDWISFSAYAEGVGLDRRRGRVGGRWVRRRRRRARALLRRADPLFGQINWRSVALLYPIFLSLSRLLMIYRGCILSLSLTPSATHGRAAGEVAFEGDGAVAAGVAAAAAADSETGA